MEAILTINDFRPSYSEIRRNMEMIAEYYEEWPKLALFIGVEKKDKSKFIVVDIGKTGDTEIWTYATNISLISN